MLKLATDVFNRMLHFYRWDTQFVGNVMHASLVETHIAQDHQRGNPSEI
jgi:hypothetical protein